MLINILLLTFIFNVKKANKTLSNSGFINLGVSLDDLIFLGFLDILKNMINRSAQDVMKIIIIK